MTPHHHPSDATILTYAAGALPEGLALVVAAHLTFCLECSAAVAKGEAIGGHLLDELAPAPLSGKTRARVLMMLAGQEPPPAPKAPEAAPAPPRDLPAPLARYLQGDLNAVAWRWLAPGMRHYGLLPQDAATRISARMLRLAPGRRLPRHGHTGTELTLVLRGSYSDALGRFAPGDVAETDDEIEHAPVSDAGSDCICLVATEGPLKFHGALARAFQFFAGL